MTQSSAPQIVGVIFSRADFQRAVRMQKPPDLFELRLDALAGSVEAIRKGIEKLPAPFIATARHPQDGGANQLSPRARRDLLIGFLERAAWVDVELRSARALAPLLRAAPAKNIRAIISFHDFRGTPHASRLDEILRAAQSLGPTIVKIATRTDTPAQMERLLDFFERHRRTKKLVAMGIGKLGKISRLELARRGCLLNYAHLGSPRVAGQLSISELREALR
jgi:3-dehydroquinate dehydratase-1